jgi:hypothetical protein
MRPPPPHPHPIIAAAGPPPPPPPPAPAARPAADVVRNAQHRHDDVENAISAAAIANNSDGGVLVADVDDVMFFSLASLAAAVSPQAKSQSGQRRAAAPRKEFHVVMGFFIVL